MEFIGGFLVAIFIYVYGSYCGIQVIAWQSGNGDLPLNPGRSVESNKYKKKQNGKVWMRMDIQENPYNSRIALFTEVDGM
jgi:hypothetical protein